MLRQRGLHEHRYSTLFGDPVGCLDNDNPTAQKVVKLLTALVGPDAAVLLADHVSKVDRDTALSSHGGGAWGDAARQTWAMRPLTELEKRQAGPGYDPSLLVALKLRKSNYTGPQPTQYLVRRTGPEGAGMLEGVDFEAARQTAASNAARQFETALLEVLTEHDVTQGELCGFVSGVGYARGCDVRNLVSEMVSRKTTIAEFKLTTAQLLADGRLAQKCPSEGKRMRLVPANVEVSNT